MVTIYVDVLMGINYIVNFLLLLGCQKISGIPCRRWRLVTGSLLGALSCLAIFLPPMHLALNTLYKLAVAFLMVWITFAPKKLKSCLYLWFILFTITFLFAGVTLALYFLVAPAGMAWYNGVVYFHLPPLLLLGTIVVAYFAVLLFERFFSRRLTPDQLYPIAIRYGGKQLTLTGLADTGNSLTEPFSNTPIIVCGLPDAISILPLEYISWFADNPSAAMAKGQPPPGYRLVSYSGIGREGVLPAFKPDQLHIVAGEKSLQKEAYVAIAPERIGNDRYNAVLNPQLIKLEIEIG